MKLANSKNWLNSVPFILKDLFNFFISADNTDKLKGIFLEERFERLCKANFTKFCKDIVTVGGFPFFFRISFLDIRIL